MTAPADFEAADAAAVVELYRGDITAMAYAILHLRADLGAARAQADPDQAGAQAPGAAT